MSVRKNIVKLGLAAAATAGLTLTALAPANAAGEDPWYQLSNSGFADGTALSSTDVLGAGSDTIQFVDGALAKAYDNPTTGSAPANKMVSLSACYEPGATQADGKTVTPGSTIQTSCAYPTGADYPFTVGGKALTKVGAGTSGDGANLLNNGGVTQPNIAFARTSGPKQVGALGLYPFALDQVVAVVSNKVKSNAPATLTRAELYGIYSGIYTNWDQLGGNNAPIHAYYPNNASSGTLAAFYGALDLESPGGAATGINVITPSVGTPAPGGAFVSNVAVNSSSLVDNGEAGKPIVEHDPAAIENDPDAVAPFSYSRIIMDEATSGDPSTSPIKALGGWVLDRAVFNELRDANLTPSGSLTGVNPDWIANYDYKGGDDSNNIVNTLFGPTGYLCSSDAASIMQRYGFYQLKPGTCGVEITSGSGNPSSLAAVGAPTVSTTAATISGRSVAVKVASGDSSVATVPTGQVSVKFIPLNTIKSTTKAPAPVMATLDASGSATVNAPSTLPAGTWEVAVSYVGDPKFQASWSDAETTAATPGTITVKSSGTTTSGGGSTTTKPGGTTTKPAPTPSVNTKLVKAEHKLAKAQKALKKAKKQFKKAHGAKKAKLHKKIKKLKKAIRADKAAVKTAK